MKEAITIATRIITAATATTANTSNNQQPTTKMYVSIKVNKNEKESRVGNKRKDKFYVK